MAAAPGHNKQFAGYLQLTVRYSRDTPLRKTKLFTSWLHFGPESILFFIVLEKTATWSIRFLADSSGILSLMTTNVTYLIPAECVTLPLTG